MNVGANSNIGPPGIGFGSGESDVAVENEEHRTKPVENPYRPGPECPGRGWYAFAPVSIEDARAAGYDVDQYEEADR